MRYIAYGLAILAAVLAIVFVTGNLTRDATASHNEPWFVCAAEAWGK
jgi:hypothetical protein